MPVCRPSHFARGCDAGTVSRYSTTTCTQQSQPTSPSLASPHARHSQLAPAVFTDPANHHPYLLDPRGARPSESSALLSFVRLCCDLLKYTAKFERHETDFFSLLFFFSFFFLLRIDSTLLYLDHHHLIIITYLSSNKRWP